MDDKEYIECQCGTIEHTLRFGWFFYDWQHFNIPEMYVETHLTSDTFFRRLRYAIRYILGKKSRYGCFGETVLHKDQVTQLRDMCNRFLKEYEDKQ